MVRLSRMQSRSWGYCTMLSPRMQPSAWVLKSRLGQLAGARAHQEASARPHRGMSFCEHAAGGLRTKRFHQKKELESCPPPYLTSEGQIKEKARKYAASAYLPLLFSPALGQLLVGPLRPLRGHSRLPARVMQPSGLRPSPTDAAAETKR